MQFRSNWTVDNSTGTYHAHVLGPTGIPSDPALAGHGVKQSEELADKLVSIEPPIDIVYSSPYYRCLQTLRPTAERLFSQGKAGRNIKVENGLRYNRLARDGMSWIFTDFCT
jgi:transcription factor C subunit 7